MRRGTSVSLGAAVAAVALGALAGAAGGSHSATTAPTTVRLHAEGAPVRIEVRFRTPRSGTFRIRGALSDAGSLRAARRVAGGRLVVPAVLAGRGGTLRIRAVRRCSANVGTWTVVSGAGAYRGFTGGGVASGGPSCSADTYPLRATYAGRLRAPTPPPLPPPSPALARAGHYGGGTSQREEVAFDVSEGGRALSALRLAVTAQCAEGSPVASRRITMSLAGPHGIGPDDSFVVRVDSFWTGGVSGRFTTATTAEGVAEAFTTASASGSTTTYPCTASVTWRASLPPPAATPGTYCGGTSQGARICLDVGSGGREMTRLEVGVTAPRLPSGQCELTLRFGSAPIGGHLGFSARASSFEGLESGEASVSGTFDEDGRGASGRVFLFHAGVVSDGRRYACRSASATWTARR